MRITFTFLIILLLVGFSKNAISQCHDLYKATQSAKELYKAGNLEGTIMLLDSSIRVANKNNCSIEIEKAKVLLTQAYLFLNYDEQAVNSYIEILETNPSYRPNPLLHPIDLIYLSEQFESVPKAKFTPEIIISNIQNVRVSRTRLPEFNQAGVKKYTSTIRPNFGFKYNIFLKNNFEFSIGTQYEERDFEIEYTSSSVDPAPPLPVVDYFDIHERQYWLKFPFMLQKNFGKQPHLKYNSAIGIEPHLLTSAYFYDTNSNLSISVDSTQHNVSEIRNRFNIGISAAIGLEYEFRNIKHNTLSLTLKYTYLPININKVGTVSNNQYLINDIGYVDDDFGFDLLQLSIGFSFYQYKVRNVKK